MSRSPTSTALALALGLALSPIATAQTKPTPAQQQELDAARATLDKAAKEFAELSRKYGHAGNNIRIEQRLQRKPVIGVLLAPDAQAGVRIAGVTPDSAAAGAGLKSGDRIMSIDGKPVVAATPEARVEQLRELLANVKTSTPVALAYERDGKPASVRLTPKLDTRVFMFNGDDGSLARFGGPVTIRRGKDGQVDVEGSDIELEFAKAGADWAPVAPEVHREVIRIGKDCKGEDCRLPAIAEAFRWNGLNLASVDAQLGRYFGTNRGVLVLSTGSDLEGLQPGDVIRSISGKDVGTPREAMDALRAQPAGGKVAVAFLRDRKSESAQVAVPASQPRVLRMDALAPMPAGRKMVFIDKDGDVQELESGKGAGWAPKPGEQVEKRRYVMIDKDGKRQEWEGDADATPPTWVQALPKDGKRVEKRVQVIVDEDGNKQVIEEEVDASP